MPLWIRSCRCLAFLLTILTVEVSICAAELPWQKLADEYRSQTLPLLKSYCLECHSTEAAEGDLDLERFRSLDEIRHDPKVWQGIRQMLATRQMPPEESPQLTADETQHLAHWVDRYLDTEALSHAGDPGPVVLRRLSNAEYTYTIQDLTGVDLQPAREFPVDGAAGEGFTNTGQSLVMSPALVRKYLDAGQAIATHAVLVPTGIQFSPSTTRRDWTNEILDSIRDIYSRYTIYEEGLDPTAISNQQEVIQARHVFVDLPNYLRVAVQHRERLLAEPQLAREYARTEQLNPKYFERLVTLLTREDSDSYLCHEIREQFLAATPDDVDSLSHFIRQWRNRLWKFNTIGHLAGVQKWQEPVNPLRERQDFAAAITASGEVDSVMFLASLAVSGGHAAGMPSYVRWENPRLVRPGQAPIALRDVPLVVARHRQVRQEIASRAAEYLAAADLWRRQKPDSVVAVARAGKLDPSLLQAWLAFLAIDSGEATTLKGHLTQPLPPAVGNDKIRGWGIAGADALSLVSNASEEAVAIPGQTRPHQVYVHPRPERWVAVGWQSPFTGKARLSARVADAHATCGNGVRWSWELQRGSVRSILGGGDVELGTQASIAPIEEFVLQRGDVISLVIDARDNNHVCDLTEIDLAISELGDTRREWSLSADCADTIMAGNPHSDRHGNSAVWHFYSGLSAESDQAPTVPANSLWGRWLQSEDADAANELAAQLQQRLQTATTNSGEELAFERELLSAEGPLMTRLDWQTASAVKGQSVSDSPYGLPSARFGHHPDDVDAPVNPEDVVMRAGETLDFRLPTDVFRGCQLVVSASVDATSHPAAAIQVRAEVTPPEQKLTMWSDQPIVVREGSAGARQWAQAFDSFREVFPASMCHARIVPVDEVVTLVLYHREDDALCRLMLEPQEIEQLDQLWNELHYVSQDALAILAALEQILEFATQDADPRRFDPVRGPINEQAATFRQWLVDTEPVHVDAVTRFAELAYRRPLRSAEQAALRDLYQSLRAAELDHEAAIRLMIARVLASPAFLYKSESSQPGVEAQPVSSTELATRMSYFFWASLPDAELLTLASSDQLRDPQVRLEQTRRMLADPRIRRFAIEFACQWLHVRDFDQHDEKSESRFPEFNALRDAMYDETIHYFTEWLQHGGSLLEILSSDYTMLNAELAKHYGIPNVDGDQWRRVDGVQRYGRGGILTQASVLAKQSGASRTSPILRGTWLSESILGERLPKPPANVPELPDNEDVPADLTIRQLVERHTAEPACRKCHVRIDPFGFALESYDAIGRFRELDGERPVDTTTELMDGTRIDGLLGLQKYLTETRRDDFVRNFCRKLLGYALGRAVQLSDEPLLDQMLVELERNDYRISTAIEMIVMSPQFTMKRGAEYGQP
ncbi:MAG: DUF1592 domain-containing protein [Planctomycetales bacterium]|nr:DUF1592 domain-containing protein [Planctomycetales bacterium]